MSDSPHTHCTAHSGMMAKLNVNLILHALAVILLGFVVNGQMDIKTGIALANAERAAIVEEISDFKEDVTIRFQILRERVDRMEHKLP